jgi:hypothetical protein
MDIDNQDKETLAALALTIQEETQKFTSNNTAFLLKGNKQAGERARVASLKITKTAKQYRAASLKVVKL